MEQSMPSQKEIQDWLVQQIAEILSTDQNQIDVREPFSSYGLSSRDAVLLSGDLEDWLDCRLSPTIVYEYPTIEALSIHLSQNGNESDVVEGISNRDNLETSSVETKTLDETLSELEQLTDEEIEALLMEKLDKFEE
jgi:acyl carrier protein